MAQEEIRVFLELTGFYRKHIDGYTRIVTPLANLLKRSKRRERTSPRVYGGRRNAEKKAITKYPIYLLHVGSSFEIKVESDHQSLQLSQERS
jgi:hypothetical protein